MKAKLFFMILLVMTLGCKKSSDDTMDNEKIKTQVKEVVNTLFSGCEQVNANTVLSTIYESADFVYVFNGTTKNYQQFSTALSGVYDLMTGQEINLVSEKFAVIDENTVIYTTNLTFLQHYNDGSSNTIDPAVMMLIFRKTENTWKWVSGVESYGS